MHVQLLRYCFYIHCKYTWVYVFQFVFCFRCSFLPPIIVDLRLFLKIIEQECASESQIYAKGVLREMPVTPACPTPYQSSNFSILCFILPLFLFVKISRYMFAFHFLFFLTQKRFLAHCFHHLTLLSGNHSISNLRAPPHSFFQLYKTAPCIYLIVHSTNILYLNT